jgi:hypothetical protein
MHHPTLTTNANCYSQNVAKAQAEIDRLEAEAETTNGTSNGDKKSSTSAEAEQKVDEAANGIENASIQDDKEEKSDVAAVSS